MRKSVTIIISHYESLPFLRTCLRQIHKYQNDNIGLWVIVADQSSKETHEKVLYEVSKYTNIKAQKIDSLYSGFGIDVITRFGNITTDYICQLHADAFPISDKWLLAPITLMEENNLHFTGVLQFIANGTESIYPPTKGVFGMAQCWNIGRTDTYKEMSLEGGFTRFHNRPKSGLTWNNNDWREWAKEDYQARGSDDDVPAFFWEDNHMEHDKLSFGFTGKIGKEGEESNYGTIIEDLVFHFGYHREAIGVMPQMGVKYREWTRRINDNYSDELIDEMLAEARKQATDSANNRMFWDGSKKLASRTSHTINQRLNELKNGK